MFNEFEDNYKKSLNNELVSFYIKTCARCFNSFNSLDVIRIESRGYGKWVKIEARAFETIKRTTKGTFFYNNKTFYWLNQSLWQKNIRYKKKV